MEVRSIDCSPCGTQIVCAYMCDWIRKFDLVSQKLIIKSLDGHDDGIAQIRYSPNGQLIASGSWDKKIIIRNAFTLQQIGITLLEGWVNSIVFLPDSLHLASASMDGTFRIWDCQNQEQVGPNIIVGERLYSLDGINACYSPSGLQILIAGYQLNYKIRNFYKIPTIQRLTFEIVRRIGKGAYGFEYQVQLNSTIIKKQLFEYNLSRMNIGDCSQTYQNKRIKVSEEELTSMDCSHCGKQIVCSCWDQWIRKYDLISQKLIHKSPSQQRRCINQIRYSPCGQLIASCSYESIIIRDAATLQKMGNRLVGHKDDVYSVDFSPDASHLVSFGHDDTIRIWDCQSSEQVGPNIAQAYARFVQYSPNGLQILSAGDEGIDISDSTTRKRIMTLTGLSSQKAQYSLDGRYIVSIKRSKVIQLWDATTGEQIESDLIGHSSDIGSVAFSPDSSLIVSGSDDQTVRLWNFAIGKQEYILHAHGKGVNTVQFSKDGKYVLSGSWDGTICIVVRKF